MQWQCNPERGDHLLVIENENEYEHHHGAGSTLEKVLYSHKDVTKILSRQI